MDKATYDEIKARETSFDPERSYITCNACGKKINIKVTAFATTALHMEICPGPGKDKTK